MAMTATRKGLLILALAVAGVTSVRAQAPSLPAAAVSTTAPASEVDAGPVRLLVGRSTVLDVGATITRVSLTSAEVADALVTAPQQLLINGKNPGTISMFVWDRGGALKRYEVIVQRDLGRLSEQMKELFPNEKIEVQSNGKNVVLSGSVSTKEVIEKVVNVAAGYVDKREEVVTLLQVSATGPSNQVLLRVRFAEVSRTALTELGASFAANGYKDGRWFGRTTTQQFAAPQWDEDGKFVFSDFLNLFLFDTQNQLAGVVRALQNRGLFQSLAEPNLVAESGKEASFLAGGEFPIPVAQGSGANIGVSVMFKEFGIRLNFTPTVNGDRVHLKVKPEVSTLDFANAVTLAGFRIPALSTRRTETELELQNGQTFAIAGLMNNSVRSSLQKIPGIGDIPIIGLLFRSKAAQKDNSELVVMITPQILPNNSPGVTNTLPRTPERYMDPLPQNRTQPQPPAAFGGTRPQADSRPAGPATSALAGGPAPAGAPTASAQGVTGQASGTMPAPAVGEPGAAAAAPALSPEEQRRADEKSREEARALARARAEQQAREQEKAEEERKRQERAAKEQAKRDAEAKRRAQEAAKKQAEVDRERQKSIDEAAARLKAAEAAYQAEVAKRNKRPQPQQ
jgi:pilus assembly protein CpaC